MSLVLIMIARMAAHAAVVGGAVTSTRVVIAMCTLATEPYVPRNLSPHPKKNRKAKPQARTTHPATVESHHLQRQRGRDEGGGGQGDKGRGGGSRKDSQKEEDGGAGTEGSWKGSRQFFHPPAPVTAAPAFAEGTAPAQTHRAAHTP